MRDALGYYAILEVAPQAGDEEIKQHYRDLAKIWHPDHSTRENALDMFQKISNAYEILKDEKKRLTYDLLCAAYPKEKFPDMFTLKILKSKKFPDELNLRMLRQISVRGWGFGYKVQENKEVCSYKEALGKTAENSILNWLLGWWHPKACVKNIEALAKNLKSPLGKDDDLTLHIHNALACWQENKLPSAAVFANMAMAEADVETKASLQKFLNLVGQPHTNLPKKWNESALRHVQFIFPAALLILAAFPFSAQVVSEADLMHYFNKKQEIGYYQQVNFRNGQGVDDVVVGKVLNIPVDIEDESKLYHVIKEVPVMYGPSDNFDEIRKLPSRTTVRITGITPDELWFRVMLDNGEMGFIRKEYLSQGRGKGIPAKSKIIAHPARAD